MQALLLPVGDDLYALELDAVREVVPRPAVTRLPRAPAAVLGVFNLRGEIVPAIDTGRLLGLPPVGAVSHVVVAETPRGPAGLATDAVPRRSTLGDPAGPSELPAGVRRHAVDAGAVATLLDPAALPELLGGG